MANRITRCGTGWILTAAIITTTAIGWPTAPRALAADPDALDSSLKLIPANAAFYSSMLRNRQQIEAIANSRAWAKLKAMPFVQMGLVMYQMQAMNPEGPVGQFQAALENPEVRPLIDLAGDMFSEEVFFYGDESWVGFLELAQQIAGTMRYGPLMLQATGEARGLDPGELQGMLLLAALSENLDLLMVPDTLVGFKLSDTDAANAQLNKLEMMAGMMIQNVPELAPLQGRLKRTKVGGHEYLTLTLDGQMIPWDEIPLEEIKDIESDQGDVDRMVAHLKKSQLVIALGVRDDHLLLSVGSSTNCLRRLGRGKSLIDQPELKPLEKFADRRLLGVGYVSKSLMTRVANSKQDIDDLLEVGDELLPLAGLKPEITAKIRKDAAALAEDIKQMIPEPGAVMALNFLTDQGIEGYQYNWGEQLLLDGSKPLGLLQHLGGSPLLAAVARSKQSPGDYDLLVKWVKVGFGYFEEFALPEMNDSERDQYLRFVELFGPLVGRVDKINREKLIPALADGQVALVFDVKLSSKQFISALPPTEEAMPMLEPALVIGISDAKLLSEGFAAYGKLLDDVLVAINEFEPGAIPEGFTIPRPEATETDLGTIYSYALPALWGVDPQIVPNFALSETVGVVSITEDHAKRLLQATPLSIGGILAETDRPLATAGMFDFAGLVDAATPWVRLAVEKIQEEQPDDPNMAAIAAQVDTVLEVLKVLRTVTFESYFEDGAMVSHTLVEIRDIEE